MHKNKSFLTSIALASTLFCLAPINVNAFALLDAGADDQNSGNPLYPPTNGYNFFAPNVDFTILNGTTIGVTGGVSIDNTINFANDNIFFAGNATVNGSIGATHAIGSINIKGASNTQVDLAGSLLNNTPLNFYNNGFVALDPAVNLTGNVNNLSGNIAGNIALTGNNTLSGNIGLTMPINSIFAESALGALSKINLTGTMINANTIIANDSGAGQTQFTVGNGTTVNAAFQTRNNNEHAIVLENSIINGNIGQPGFLFNSVKVDNGRNPTINGDVYATNTFISAISGAPVFSSSLSIGNGYSFFGPVDAFVGTNHPTILNFLGSSTINFPIGVGNALDQVNITGPVGTVVTLANNIGANHGVNVNNGGTLSISGICADCTVSQDLNISNHSVLLVQPNAFIEPENNFNLAAGTTLQLDMGGNQFEIGGVFADNQAILDPNATIEILNPGFVPFHTVNTPAIVSDGVIFGVAHPVVTTSLLTMITTSLGDGGHSLVLNLSSAPSRSFANQSNTEGVAGAIDNIGSPVVAFGDTPASGELQEILNQMGIFRDPESLNNALATLAPIVDGAILYESWNTQNTVFGEVGSRMDRMNFWRHHQTVNTSGIGAGDEIYTKNGAWAKIFRQHGNQQIRQSVAGYKDDTWGVIVGTDSMITDDTLLGISLSWATLDIDNDVSSSHTSANSYQATLYTSLDYDCPLYMTGAVGFAFNKYNEARNIIFNQVELFPRAKFSGIQLGAKAEAGYVYSFYTFDIIPIASLFYSHLSLNAFNERGAGNASQHVDEEDFNTLLGGVGIKIVDSYEINKCVLLQSELHAMAFYDALNDRMQTTSQFVGAGPSFTTKGFTPARASYNVGTSLSLYNIFNYIFTGEYDFYAKEDYTSNSVFLKMRYEWN